VYDEPVPCLDFFSGVSREKLLPWSERPGFSHFSIELALPFSFPGRNFLSGRKLFFVPFVLSSVSLQAFEPSIFFFPS